MNDEIEWEHEDAGERRTGNLGKTGDGRVIVWVCNHDRHDEYMENDNTAEVEIQREEAAQIIMFLENAFPTKPVADGDSGVTGRLPHPIPGDDDWYEYNESRRKEAQQIV